MEILAPYFRADGQIAHHPDVVCSSGKSNAHDFVEAEEWGQNQVQAQYSREWNGISDDF